MSTLPVVLGVGLAVAVGVAEAVGNTGRGTVCGESWRGVVVACAASPARSLRLLSLWLPSPDCPLELPSLPLSPGAGSWLPGPALPRSPPRSLSPVPGACEEVAPPLVASPLDELSGSLLLACSDGLGVPLLVADPGLSEPVGVGVADVVEAEVAAAGSVEVRDGAAEWSCSE